MNKIVLDASVAIKWFFEEIHEERAVSVMSHIRECSREAIIPDFFYTECANVLRGKIKAKMSTVEEAHRTLLSIQNLPLKRHHEDLADIALDNALIYDISVYDALYVSLAEIYVAPLITADDQLVKACRKFPYIQHLRDYK